MAESQRACLITGGSSGIGLSAARRFAREGWHVLICGRDAARLEAAADEIRTDSVGQTVVTQSVDVADTGSVKRLFECAARELGRLDLLVNNAGVAPNVPAAQMSDEQFDRVLATNIKGVFNCVRAAWPMMQAAGGGIIVNISSQAATDPFAGFSVYGGSKAFVDLFTKVVAEEGKPHNIAVFSLRPGAVDTPLLRGLFPDFPADQAVTPDEVAGVIWQLVDPAMRFSAGDPISVKR